MLGYTRQALCGRQRFVQPIRKRFFEPYKKGFRVQNASSRRRKDAATHFGLSSSSPATRCLTTSALKPTAHSLADKTPYLEEGVSGAAANGTCRCGLQAGSVWRVDAYVVKLLHHLRRVTLMRGIQHGRATIRPVAQHSRQARLRSRQPGPAAAFQLQGKTSERKRVETSRLQRTSSGK